MATVLLLLPARSDGVWLFFLYNNTLSKGRTYTIFCFLIKTQWKTTVKTNTLHCPGKYTTALLQHIPFDRLHCWRHFRSRQLHTKAKEELYVQCLKDRGLFSNLSSTARSLPMWEGRSWRQATSSSSAWRAISESGFLLVDSTLRVSRARSPDSMLPPLDTLLVLVWRKGLNGDETESWLQRSALRNKTAMDFSFFFSEIFSVAQMFCISVVGVSVASQVSEIVNFSNGLGSNHQVQLPTILMHLNNQCVYWCAWNHTQPQQ